MSLFSALEKFDIICYIPLEFFNFLDLSITNFMVYVSFVLFIIFSFFLLNSYNSIIPTLNRVFFHTLSAFVFEQVEKQIGVKGFVYYPFFFLLFFFILICNLLGLVPFSFSPTAHMTLTFFLSLVIWCSALSLGFLENGLGFVKFFLPDVPVFLLPMLFVIEIFSYLIRVFSLAIRLAANITAGHVLLFTIAGFAAKLLEFNFFVFLLTLIALVLIYLLEVGVAFLQAYVFVTLACIYFNDSLNMSH